MQNIANTEGKAISGYYNYCPWSCSYRHLRLFLPSSSPGSTTTIKPSDLRATDVDSDDSDIIYTMKKNPTAGRLQYRAPDGTTSVLTVEGPRSVFTQDDIDHGQ